MLQKAVHFSFHETESELEAILLEAALINRFQPPYNIELKDDKSPLYIAITQETYPRILTVRKNDLLSLKTQNIYGPFLSAGITKYLLRELRPIFPYCNASPQQKKKNQACFYFHLKLCPGACCSAITPQAYASHIHPLKTLFSGDLKKLKSDLNHQILSASKNHDYESASVYKAKLEKLIAFEHNFFPHPSPPHSPRPHESLNQISVLETLCKRHSFLTPSQTLHRIEFYDIANLSGKYATGSMVVFQDGQAQKSAYRHFHLKTIKTPNDPAMLKEVITRRLNHSEWSFPDLFLIDGGKSQLSVINLVVPEAFPLAGLAKHPDHLILRLKNQCFQAVSLSPTSPATLLLQAMRDEAHRFAQKLFHRTFLKQYQ